METARHQVEKQELNKPLFCANAFLWDFSSSYKSVSLCVTLRLQTLRDYWLEHFHLHRTTEVSLFVISVEVAKHHH